MKAITIGYARCSTDKQDLTAQKAALQNLGVPSAVASIARITGGNFRLLHRLFTQIERIMEINELTVITDEVVEAARSTLVIGAT